MAVRTRWTACVKKSVNHLTLGQNLSMLLNPSIDGIYIYIYIHSMFNPLHDGHPDCTTDHIWPSHRLYMAWMTNYDHQGKIRLLCNKTIKGHRFWRALFRKQLLGHPGIGLVCGAIQLKIGEQNQLGINATCKWGIHEIPSPFIKNMSVG